MLLQLSLLSLAFLARLLVVDFVLLVEFLLLATFVAFAIIYISNILFDFCFIKASVLFIAYCLLWLSLRLSVPSK